MPQIKVFALSTCPYCKQARAFLDESGVAYDVVEVDKLTGQERTDAIEEVKTLSGGTSFPVLVMDGEVVVGYNKARIQQLIGA
ncbi:MAG TPA: glutaredoxin family protein [Coriobacteriia bacterium]